MARFETAVAKLREVEESPIKLPEPPAIDLSEKKIELDYMADVQQTIDTAKERREKEGRGLKLSAIDLGTGLADLSALAALSENEKLLQEAKSLITKEDFAAALEILDRLLVKDPHHHEGLYFRAVCHAGTASMEHDLEALRTLVRLREARLETQLQDRVNIIRFQIRDRMIPTVMLRTLMLGNIGGFRAVVPQLRELVELDPDMVAYHLLLVQSLAMAQQLDEALAAVRQALQVAAPEGRERLQALDQQLRRQHLTVLLRPVVAPLKKHRYRAARSKLRKIAPKYQSDSFYRAFEAYVQKLQGGVLGFLQRNRSQGLPRPRRGPHTELIYFLLVDDELAAAQQLIGRQAFAQAEDVLRSAVPFASDFPYLRFLLAGCTFRRVNDQLSQGKAPGIDAVIAMLEEARENARRGATDPDIRDAETLSKTVQASLDTLESIRDAIRKREEEVKALNAAIGAFHNIMKSAEGGIDSPRQLESIHDRLKELKAGLPSLRKKVTNDEGKKALAQLSKAISENYKQITSMRKEMEARRREQEREAKPLNEAAKEFSRIMKSAEGGIGSPEQFDRISDRLKKLQAGLPKLRRKIKSKAGKEAFKNLHQAVEKNFKQLQSTRGSVENQVVNQTIGGFNTVMQALEKQGGVKSRKEREQYRQLFRSLDDKITKDRRGLTDSKARQRLDELSRTIGKVLDQLSG